MDNNIVNKQNIFAQFGIASKAIPTGSDVMSTKEVKPIDIFSKNENVPKSSELDNLDSIFSSVMKNNDNEDGFLG